MKIKLVRPEDIDEAGAMLLPHIYRELKEYYIDGNDYVVLSAVTDEGEVSSVIAAKLEATGDINILSIFTVPQLRRKGYASFLVDGLVDTALKLFCFDEDESEDDVVLKTLYRLPEDLESVFRPFLEKNNFTDFVILDESEGLKTISAFAEIRFFIKQG